MHRLTIFATTAVCCALLISRVASAGTILYSAIRLGTVVDPFGEVTAMNNNGQVVGWQQDPSYFDHGFLDTAGAMANLVPVGATSTQPTGINSQGQVVGVYDGSDSQRHVFLYSGGTFTDVPGLAGVGGISSTGVIVGFISASPGHPASYSGGVLTDLGTLSGVGSGSATAVNDAGEIVGNSNASATASRAFLWSNGVLQDLGDLGGTAVGAQSSAKGINNNGQVVGYAMVPSGNYHPFLYSGGVMKDLGLFPGDYFGEALGINNIGQVVGMTEPPIGNSRAFLYSGSSIIDLNTLLAPASSGWQLLEADAINDKGWIAGIGFAPGDTTNMVPFLLVPVPEPAAVGLLAIGGLILALAQSVKRRPRRIASTPRTA